MPDQEPRHNFAAKIFRTWVSLVWNSLPLSVPSTVTQSSSVQKLAKRPFYLLKLILIENIRFIVYSIYYIEYIYVFYLLWWTLKTIAVLLTGLTNKYTRYMSSSKLLSNLV